METGNAVAGLSALAQGTRLAVFRFLVQQGREGVPAGTISQRLGISPNGLSFHLTRLLYAGLVTARRNGRYIIYAADFEGMRELMEFLTENCCENATEGCSSACPQPWSDEPDQKPRRHVARSARQPRPHS